MEQTTLVRQVETYTYLEELEDEPMEVLLIGIPADRLGTDNTFEPPGFHREHITTWLRQRYFFLDGVVYAQVPRRTDEYPEVVQDQFNCGTAFATDITQDGPTLHIYYPFNDSRCVCLSWDTAVDHWSMSEVQQPSDNHNIISDRGHAADNRLLWESR